MTRRETTVMPKLRSLHT